MAELDWRVLFGLEGERKRDWLGENCSGLEHRRGGDRLGGTGRGRPEKGKKLGTGTLNIGEVEIG